MSALIKAHTWASCFCFSSIFSFFSSISCSSVRKRQHVVIGLGLIFFSLLLDGIKKKWFQFHCSNSMGRAIPLSMIVGRSPMTAGWTVLRRLQGTLEQHRPRDIRNHPLCLDQDDVLGNVIGLGDQKKA